MFFINKKAFLTILLLAGQSVVAGGNIDLEEVEAISMAYDQAAKLASFINEKSKSMDCFTTVASIRKN